MIQKIHVKFEGTIEVNIDPGDNPEDSFDFLFDALGGRTVQITTTAPGYVFDFDIHGMGYPSGRKWSES